LHLEKIFHISEVGAIQTFHPRPSPSKFDGINGDVVFGISDKLLHNYLFPRDCPRVTYYAGAGTSQFDKEIFLSSQSKYVLAIEAKWLPILQNTTLFCYEFNADSFVLLDECAGYYVSYHQLNPISVRRVENPFSELVNNPDIELRILPSLWSLADSVVKSSLNYSLIRMKNAIPRDL